MVTASVRCLFAVIFMLDAKPPPSTEPVRFAADRPVDIKHIALDLRVDVPAKHVEGTATIDFVAQREVSSVRFDAVEFVVTTVTLARDARPPAPADYLNGGESIEVFFGEKLTEGSSAKIRVTYSITDPKSGLHFFGPSEAEPDVPYVMWSQGESIDNRYWVPCFDNPNEMQTTEMTVTVSAGNEAVSNGRLLSKVDNTDKTTTFHWLQDKPHVSYLMTLVVGEFYVEQDTWRGKPVVYYVPTKHKNDLRRSFSKTVGMLEHFSNITGVEYPWDKYAQICVEGFGGGMENTSATTLGPRTLHDE
ncbi:MAG: aminopeptidase, partial [Planctomycetota bacterium]